MVLNNGPELADLLLGCFARELVAVPVNPRTHRAVQRQTLEHADPSLVYWQEGDLSQLFQRSLFVAMERDHGSLMASHYFARKDFSGDPSRWWSFRPPEYNDLVHLDCYHQIAGFLISIEMAMEAARRAIHPERWLTVNYEKWLEDPRAVYQAIASKLASQGHALPPYRGPARFAAKSVRSLDDATRDALLHAYEEQRGVEPV